MSRSPRKLLTKAEKAFLRSVISEMIAETKASTPDPNNRLAAFFGGMVGRAGFDGFHKITELYEVESSAHEGALK